MKAILPRLLAAASLLAAVFLLRGFPPSVPRPAARLAGDELERARELFPPAESLRAAAPFAEVLGSQGEFLGWWADGSAAASAHAGYGGPVPFRLGLDRQRRVVGIVLLPSRETSDFLERVETSGLLQVWNGLPAEAAAEIQVDSVSGATVTSSALIASIRDLLRETGSVPVSPPSARPGRYTRAEAALAWAALALALGGFFLPRLPRFYRVFTLAAVLGGLGIAENASLSLGLFWNWARLSPARLAAAFGVFPLVLVLSSLIVNLITGRNFYCRWACPLGGAQELAGRFGRVRRRLPRKLAAAGRFARLAALGAVCLLAGSGLADPARLEPFAAFHGAAAGTVPLVLAGLALGISFVYPRAWCRLLCPTGALMSLLSGRGGNF